MKLTTLANAQDKVQRLAKILSLMFFCGGCASQANQTGSIQTCSQAEAAVKLAQEKYDDVILQLAIKNINPNVAPDASVFENLESAQERAFESCNKFY